MSSDVRSSLPPSKRLTLRRIMGAIAGSALAFASLPWFLSIPLVVAVFGILGLDGIHPPLVTSGGGVRRWVPWAVWSLGLAACPIAMAVLDTVYEHGGPPVYDRWVARVLESQPGHARRLLNDRHYNDWVARLQAIQSGRAQLYRGDRVYDRWVARVLERLFQAHLGIMVIASVAVVVLTAGSYRWWAWAAILAVGVLGRFLFDSYLVATCVPHY
jgi:hypothetical protein